MIQHFKQDDPHGIPGVPIPDPMPIPDFEGQFPGAKMKFSEAELFNLSQFRIDYVRTDLKDLKVLTLVSMAILVVHVAVFYVLCKVWVGLTFDALQVLGRYRMSSWLSTSSGDFNVTLVGVHAQGFAGLEVDPEGVLQASNITLNLGFKDIEMMFDNLGFFGNLFQVGQRKKDFSFT